MLGLCYVNSLLCKTLSVLSIARSITAVGVLFMSIPLLAGMAAEPGFDAANNLAHDGPGTIEETSLFALTLEEALELMVITPSKVEQRIIDAPGIVEVITKKQIEDFGASTLRDVLERATSVTGLTSFLHRNVISIRGDQILPTSSHVLVLINGRPTRERIQSGTDTDIYAMFPLNIIEKIEIVRGPGSVLYGTNAYSGVINIITQKKPANEISAFVNDNSGGGFSANFKSIKGNQRVVGAVRSFDLGSWDQSYTNSSRVTQNVSVRDRGTSAFLDIDLSENLNINLAYLEYFTHQLLPRAGVPRPSEFKRSFVNLKYKHQVSEEWDMEFNLTNTYHFLQALIERRSNDFVAEWTNYFSYDRLNVIAGGLINSYQGREYLLRTGKTLTVPHTREFSGSMYLQLDYKLFDNLKLISGVQANKIESINVDIVPRIGAIWKISPRWNLKSAFGEAYRSPSIQNTSVDDGILKGSPDLEPEKVSTFDIELSYLSKKFTGAVAFFHSKQTGLIGRDTSVTPITFQNFGIFRSRGVEFKGKYHANEKVYFLCSITYLENKLNSIKNASPVGRFSAKAGISWKVTDFLQLGVFDIYSSKPADVGLVEPSRAIVNSVPKSYHLLTLNANIDLTEMLKLKDNVKWTAYIRIDNALNEDINHPEWANKTINSIPGKRGRDVYFGIKGFF